jgi:hypothetical protein
MRFVALNTIILIAACALSTGATAQKTYKCGNSYSQLPCPDGEVIDTADPRTPEQKSQADAATRRDALAADALEKSRLEQEKRALAARPPPPPPASDILAPVPMRWLIPFPYQSDMLLLRLAVLQHCLRLRA